MMTTQVKSGQVTEGNLAAKRDITKKKKKKKKNAGSCVAAERRGAEIRETVIRYEK